VIPSIRTVGYSQMATTTDVSSQRCHRRVYMDLSLGECLELLRAEDRLSSAGECEGRVRQ
jgi:hypothetical protein